MVAQSLKFAILSLIVIAGSSVNASDILGRVVGGVDASASHAFAVRIHSVVDDSAENAYLSSGVAISSNVIATVAQAIDGFSIWYVYSGSIVLANQEFQESREGHRHPDYNPITLNNNVGIILLQQQLGNYIPIALPGATIGTYQLFGYGVNANNQLPSVLQTSPYIAVSQEECSSFYTSTYVTENNFCARSVQASAWTTNGDQGGPFIPLFLDLQVTGVTSFWGRNTSYPVVFERLHNYRDFIDQFL